ncbi:Mobile element protein [Polaromonas sp. CG9_12]|nr:Mobile element protein [Polaromonas sp. CG9_12]
MLRLSMDAKASVKVGEFSRNGVSRVTTQALDHDFEPEAQVTPVGILLPQHDALHLFTVTGKVTSDCLADCLEDFWVGQRQHFPRVDTLLLNLDNGPECHSRRTQFMARMVEFVQHTGLAVRLAYYPPYHSKYNPIECCWGVLENHWNGSLLDSVEAVERFAASMTWKGVHPVVQRVTTVYESGVKLTKDAMCVLETKLQRLPELDKWFVDILPAPATPATG